MEPLTCNDLSILLICSSYKKHVQSSLIPQNRILPFIPVIITLQKNISKIYAFVDFFLQTLKHGQFHIYKNMPMFTLTDRVMISTINNKPITCVGVATSILFFFLFPAGFCFSCSGHVQCLKRHH
ncbi:hypothetical protein V6Z11_A06G176700 [Gossypium hirsutum]